jgi:hypothetical protein
MNILLIQKEGIDLHTTLFYSETSRMILRFYHPKRKPCGVYLTVSTLGSGLSLVAEMRWYLRRYMREVLFEVSKGIYCTHALAQDVYYERTAVLDPHWPFRKLYGFRDGKIFTQLVMDEGSTREEYQKEYAGGDQCLEIWCTEDELGERVEPEPDTVPGP